MREEALAGFKAGRNDILVATDVAGRGLDIEGVTHVINFTLPREIDRYCHRIGRTGRAGKEGLATSILGDDDSHIFRDLAAYLKTTGQEAAAPRELLQALREEDRDANALMRGQRQ